MASMTRHSMSESPVKVFRPEASSLETPEKELDNISIYARDSSSFSSIGNDDFRNRFSLTPGPLHSKPQQSQDARVCRRTPGPSAGEKEGSKVQTVTAMSEIDMEIENRQQHRHAQKHMHVGAFEHAFSNSPFMKDSQGVSKYANNYDNSGSPAGPGKHPLQPIHRLSPRLQDPNTFVSVEEGAGGGYDSRDFSTVPSGRDRERSTCRDSSQQYLVSGSGLNAKIPHFAISGLEEERKGESSSPTQNRITRDLQALMTSPLTVITADTDKDSGKEKEGQRGRDEEGLDMAAVDGGVFEVRQCLFPLPTLDHSDKNAFQLDHNEASSVSLSSSHTSVGKSSLEGESHRGTGQLKTHGGLSVPGQHFDVSPGKNIHSAVFEPMQQRKSEAFDGRDSSSHFEQSYSRPSYLQHPGAEQPSQMHAYSVPPQSHSFSSHSEASRYEIIHQLGGDLTPSLQQQRHHHHHDQSRQQQYQQHSEFYPSGRHYNASHPPHQQDRSQSINQPHMHPFNLFQHPPQCQQDPHNPLLSSISSVGSDDNSQSSGYPVPPPPSMRNGSPPLISAASNQRSHQHQQQHQQHQHLSMANSHLGGGNQPLFSGGQVYGGNHSSAPMRAHTHPHHTSVHTHQMPAQHALSLAPPPHSQPLASNPMRKTYPPPALAAHQPSLAASLDTNPHTKYFAALPHSQGAGETGANSSIIGRRSREDPTKAIRQEQTESPNSKASYKSFLKTFTMKEASSADDALQFAQDEAVKVSPKIKWRVYLDTADLLKRNKRLDDARYMYALASDEFPTVHQGWMEWARMEEECGRFSYSLKILRRGNRLSAGYNEVLVMKAIKQHEKLGHLSGARDMLGKLQGEPLERIWRTVLEGTMLEERAGHVAVARRLLEVLMHRVAWYGPIYYEAFRLEEKAELFHQAHGVIRRGLAELPRYGPLWFGLLRVMERADISAELKTWQKGDGAAPLLTRVRAECENATSSISRELVWKVHFEQAQIEERAAVEVATSQAAATNTCVEECLSVLLAPARQCFVLSMLACPSNLRWKVFLAGARMELSAGRIDAVKSLLKQAHVEVPEKSRYHVFLECSRLEEYAGSVEEARRVLAIARTSIKNEWKIYLENVLVESRAGDLTAAVFVADQALREDSGSGRLWALLLQLVHRLDWKKDIRRRLAHGQDLKSVRSSGHGSCPDLRITPNAYIHVPHDYEAPSKGGVLARALEVVPKSGEVWCEGARVFLNPFSFEAFQPFRALQFLSFAVMFTPQYGDSFVEYTRLEMLLQVVFPRALALLGVPIEAFCGLVSTYDPESDVVQLISHVTGLRPPQQQRSVLNIQHSTLFPADREQRKINMSLAVKGLLDLRTAASCYKEVDLSRLYRRCLNADPNYGTAWFYFRDRPIDTPGTIIDAARTKLTHELTLTEAVYTRAMVQYISRVIMNHCTDTSSRTDVCPFDFSSWKEDWATLETASPLPAPLVQSEGLRVLCAQDFITGTVELSRALCVTGRDASPQERREMLYGSDQIASK